MTTSSFDSIIRISGPVSSQCIVRVMRREPCPGIFRFFFWLRYQSEDRIDLSITAIKTSPPPPLHLHSLVSASIFAPLTSQPLQGRVEKPKYWTEATFLVNNESDSFRSRKEEREVYYTAAKNERNFGGKKTDEKETAVTQTCEREEGNSTMRIKCIVQRPFSEDRTHTHTHKRS